MTVSCAGAADTGAAAGAEVSSAMTALVFGTSPLCLAGCCLYGRGQGTTPCGVGWKLHIYSCKLAKLKEGKLQRKDLQADKFLRGKQVQNKKVY